MFLIILLISSTNYEKQLSSFCNNEQIVCCHSIDWDHCLATTLGKQIFAKKLLKEYRKSIILFGSNRQNNFIDLYCRILYLNGSVFSGLSKFVKLLNNNKNFFLYPILLSDIYLNKEVGYVFHNKSYTCMQIDFFKITLLFLQLHEISNLLSTSKIEFNFYDDRLNIIEKLQSFYTKERIPKNILFKLFHFDGKQLQEKYVQQGVKDNINDYKEKLRKANEANVSLRRVCNYDLNKLEKFLN